MRMRKSTPAAGRLSKKAPPAVRKRQSGSQGRSQADRLVDARRAVVASEERLALALDSSRRGVFDWDVPAGHVLYTLTRSFAELPLVPETRSTRPVLPEYGVTSPAEWNLNTHPDDAHSALVATDAAIAGLTDKFTTVVRRRTRDGWQWIESRGKVVQRDSQGRATRIVGTFEDVDEGLSEEAKRRRHEASLYQNMRLTAIAEVTSGLSHELNQPLAVAMSAIQAAERMIRKGRPRRAALLARLADAASFVERAGETVRRFRQLASSRSREQETFDVVESARRVVETLERDARRSGIAVSVDAGSHARPLVGDRIQIEQVILNLVRNGIESVSASEQHPRRVTVYVGEVDDRVVVRVTDSGPGVPEGVRGSLFTPFFTTKAEGTGLGLPLSRTIAEAHGGRLTLECGEAGRTSFLLTLP
jgi:C4-dicarboxylate-specific signal transduction histidine kinase